MWATHAAAIRRLTRTNGCAELPVPGHVLAKAAARLKNLPRLGEVLREDPMRKLHRTTRRASSRAVSFQTVSQCSWCAWPESPGR